MALKQFPKSQSTRECTYLVRSRTGIYTFRWNIANQDGYQQIKTSLKTRDYLQAIAMASALAQSLRSIESPTIEEVKFVFEEFRGASAKCKTRVSSLDIEPRLVDLAPKSQLEYRNCWLSFVSLLDSKITTEKIRKEHIENWKTSQTCSETTLKKKLRLLSSCFNRLELNHEAEWFRLKVKKSTKRPKRALLEHEMIRVLALTADYRLSKLGTREGVWRYYLPRMAVLTGCRLNELSQLQVQDITLGQKPHLSINDFDEQKHLKNEASRRDIPLVGSFVELVEPLIKGRKGAERIFDDLPYRKTGGFSPVPSKWFSSLFRNEFADEPVTFHSIRHYVITLLFNENFHEALIAELVGHTVGKGITGKVYMSGFRSDLKRSAVSYLASNLSDIDT